MRKPFSKTKQFHYMILTPSKLSPQKTIQFVQREVLPPGETVKTFHGYPTLFHALLVANTLSNIAFVYQVGINNKIYQDNRNWFGRFLVFETSKKPIELKLKHARLVPVIDGRLPAHIVDQHVVNFLKRDESWSWNERVGAMQEQKTLGDIHNHAEHLLRDFVYDGLNINANPKIDVEQAKTHLAAVQSTSINVHYLQEDALGYLGEKNVDPDKDYDHESNRFCATNEVDIPEKYIALTRSGFRPSSYISPPSSPVYMMSTLVHEATHMAQAYRAIFLLQQWRRLPKKGRKDFHLWAYKLSNKRKSHISRYDAILVLYLCRRMNANEMIEIEAHIEGWMMKVQYLPLADLQLESNSAEFPLILGDFVTIQREYYGKQFAFPERMLDHLKLRLVKVYQNLSTRRKQLLNTTLIAYIKKVKQRKQDAGFFEWLAEIWKLDLTGI